MLKGGLAKFTSGLVFNLTNKVTELFNSSLEIIKLTEEAEQ